MLPVELAWLHAELSGARAAGAGDVVLNIGSGPIGSARRPHLSQLEEFASGESKLVNVDRFDGPGVDYVGSIEDPALWQVLARFDRPRVVLSNVLEHVDDPSRCAEMVAHHLAPGSTLFVTVPYAYPHHPDPIDNGLRLRGEEVASLFPRLELRRHTTLDGGFFFTHLRSQRAILKTLAGNVLLTRTRSRMLYLHRRIQVGAAVLEAAG